MSKLTILSISMILSSSFVISQEDTVAFDLNNQNLLERELSSFSEPKLIARAQSLVDESKDLESEKKSTQNPARLKEISARMGEIFDELSTIQKLLVALGAGFSLNALLDDGYSDNVPPVITINGSSSLTIELGSSYTDQGATAMDLFHGATPVISSGTVNTAVVGVYTITYTATDKSGNTATASRTVNVTDTTAPSITITGTNPATVELGGTYSDAGATASDLSGAVTVVSSGSVDTDTVGVYTITYTSTDESGNVGTASRTVNVTDTTVPVFTSSSIFVVDEGATTVGTVTATDLQSVVFTISGDVLSITSSGLLTFISPADYECWVF